MNKTKSTTPKTETAAYELFGIPCHEDVFQGGIFFILAIAALRIAGDILMPLAAALILAFAFQPLQRFLLRMGIPAYASAFLIILMLLGGAVSLGSALSAPAASWAARIPDSLPELKGKLRFFSQPVEKTKQLVTQAEDIAAGTGPKATPVLVQGNRLFDRLVNGAGSAASELVTTLLLLFFLLAAGDIFVRRAVEILPGLRNRRHIVDMFRQIEVDISRYLMTITVMNVLVGLAAGLIMWAYGIQDPMLWGIVAFLFNYVPIMGPVMAFVLFLVVGLMEIDNLWAALMPAILFLCAHVLESSFITPRRLARQFTINPLIVILGLVFWYWMWGFAGALLSMPMIVITKIVLSRVETLKPVGHLLEG